MTSTETSEEASHAGSAEFLWGVATSAYQSEGGYNGEGQPQTNWAIAEQLGKVAHLGGAAEFGSRYGHDFRLAREMGLNAFRLGVEWSRVQPSCSGEVLESAPPFDEAAIEHYAQMLRTCRAEGLEPVVTLHHFVHPAWLGDDAWLQPRVVDLFQAYAVYVIRRLNERLTSTSDGRPLRFIVTINEPNMLVLNTYFGRQFPSGNEGGIRTSVHAYGHLLAAHIAAYNGLHDLYDEHGWEKPMLAFNTYASDVYWSEKLLYDLMFARVRGVQREDLGGYIWKKATAFKTAFREARIHLKRDLPFQIGSLVKWICNRLAEKRFDPEGFAAALDALYASPRERVLDYVGLDYYDPFLAHSIRLPRLSDLESRDHSLRAWMINSVTSKWWDWRVLPEGLRFFCRYYSEEMDLPVLIAENGMALYRSWHNHVIRRRDGMRRSRFLELFVHEICRMRRANIPLLGYLHWSMFDNYEWGSYTPRFGLFALDFAHGTERLVEDHLGDRPSETYKRLVAEARAHSTS